MPTQALAFALAASIYPPAVAAVIALGRGAQVRSRVFAFVAAAAITTYATGTVMLLALEELGATSTSNRSASAGINLILGVALLVLAVRLRTHKADNAADAATSAKPSKVERYLQSRRLAFLLGITLYIIPSPIYVGAVKAIADAKLSTSAELLALAATVATMLWLIELPMLMLLAAPGWASDALERLNRWFAAHGRQVAVVVSAAGGLYLCIKGLTDLIS
jgi:hypothetical protein